MSNNNNNNRLFDYCITESDIMKKLFELSSTNKYSRNELVKLANIKRDEIQNKISPEIELIKMILPEDEGQRINEVAKSLILFSNNPKNSSNFEFLGESRVRF